MIKLDVAETEYAATKTTPASFLCNIVKTEI